MKVHFFTIVYNGMPWITHHLPIFNRSLFDWDWTIIEGTAKPVKDTAWCRTIPAGKSTDGTSEYLESISSHPRVRIVSRPSWEGKAEMCNHALSLMSEPGLLWQFDCDEIWSDDSIDEVRDQFMFHSSIGRADFKCQYFVGQNIVVDHVPDTWTNHYDWEWRRVWRYVPGMQFKTHEPPDIELQIPGILSAEVTNRLGIGFQHFSYVLESQVRFKEEYYGYSGAVDGWRRLQKNKTWPAPLKDFFPWVKDAATARLLYEH